MRRREFITLLGGAAAWPLAARAQRLDPVRRVGVLSQSTTITIPVLALREELAKLGWVEGHNLRTELRFTGADTDRIHAYASELVSLAPDVIVTDILATTRELQHQTSTIPIVVTGIGDPGTNRLVKDIAHPEGNTTGITNLFASIGGKWLELLKQASPQLERVGLIYNAQLITSDAGGYFPSIEEAARSSAVKVIKLPYRDAVDIVHEIDAFAADSNGGLIVMPPPPNAANREALLRLAVRHRLPSIHIARGYAAEGGLLSYGSNTNDRWRRAASFVDRIFGGAKVSDLPVEFPTKFELVVNLKTAKAIGLTIPESFLLRADEVIE
jgi:putative ABC transport system substrate-binding protein